MQEYKMYIGGEFVDAESGKTFVTVNPATGEELARVPLAGDADVDKAVKAARAAFPVWSKMTQAERGEIMKKIAVAIRENAQELAMTECLEHGTPISDALGVCMGAADKFEIGAGIARALMGTQIPFDEHTVSYFKREPAGVVALIIPWNFPIIMMAVKLSSAMATGNTCVIKPPSINSATDLKFAEIINSVAELPKGVVNVISGPGGSVGKALATHPDVDMIGFTGSSETGKQILSYASQTVKKCVMELGGNNPVLVMEDANIDKLVEVLGFRQYNNCGQHCSGPGRYYIHEKIYDKFLAKFLAFAKSVKVGDPTDPATFMGPVVSREHMNKVNGYIAGAIEEGATLYYQAENTPAEERGFYVMPTIVTDVTHDMKIAREEVFGPVAVFIKYNDNDDLIALANDSPYGLCAHVWTEDYKRAMNMITDLRCGNVFINCQSLTEEQSWGTSVKESGIGKEGGLLGMAEFTDFKMVTIAY